MPMNRLVGALLIPALLLFLLRGRSWKVFTHAPFPTVRQKDGAGNCNNFPFVELSVSEDKDPTTKLATYEGELSRKVYVLNTTQTFSVVAPYISHSEPYRLEQVERQSKRHQCSWAANGGPFHKDGSTAGSLIINNEILVDDFGGAVGFGVSAVAGNPRWVLGSLTKSEALELGLSFFVTGFDWLVYNGRNVASNCTNEPPINRAPRTTMGVDHSGNLILVVADGCERCLRKRGPTLNEMADFLVQKLGLRYAVNMDGGSSSTMVRGGRVINKPTCLDVDFVTCTRPVASVVCVKNVGGR